MQLWERGNLELKPGVGRAGRCRVVVIDLKSQAVVEHPKEYRGLMENPRPLAEGQVEVTWTEAGRVRIVESKAPQDWKWSQPSAAWEMGRYPPDAILQAIFVAGLVT